MVSPSGTDVLEGPRTGPDAALVGGGGQAYVVEAGGTVGLLSPDGREIADELTLSTELTGAAVDDEGTLWLVDLGTGELVEIADAVVQGRQQIGSRDEGSSIGLTGEAPFVVDPAAAELIDGSGDRHPLEAEDGSRLLPAQASDGGSVAWVASPDDGHLLGVDLADGTVLTPVALGSPEDRLGQPIVAEGIVYVANLTRGSVFLVDAEEGGAPIDEISIIPGGGTFVLRSTDGYVVFDDEQSPRAGVLSPDGGDYQRLNKNADGVATPPTTTTTTTPRHHHHDDHDRCHPVGRPRWHNGPGHDRPGGGGGGGGVAAAAAPSPSAGSEL